MLYKERHGCWTRQAIRPALTTNNEYTNSYREFTINTRIIYSRIKRNKTLKSQLRPELHQYGLSPFCREQCRHLFYFIIKLMHQNIKNVKKTRNAFSGLWYLPHSHVHNERTVPIIMAGCIAHSQNGHISTSDLKSDVPIVFLDPNFLYDAKILAIRQ